VKTSSTTSQKVPRMHYDGIRHPSHHWCASKVQTNCHLSTDDLWLLLMSLTLAEEATVGTVRVRQRWLPSASIGQRHPLLRVLLPQTGFIADSRRSVWSARLKSAALSALSSPHCKGTHRADPPTRHRQRSSSWIIHSNNKHWGRAESFNMLWVQGLCRQV